MLSIQDLIDIKIKKREKIYKVLNVPELGGEIKVAIPSLEEVEEYAEIEIKDRTGKVDAKKTSREKAKKLVYYQTIEPKLSDDKLIDKFKVNDCPDEVVYKIMSEQTAESLAVAILALFDKETEKYRIRVVEEAKN